MNIRKGIATYYLLALLLGFIVVGLLIYQFYRTVSVIPEYKAPVIPSETSLGVSSTTCDNAEKLGLCDGLNIAYGDGYREECHSVFSIC